MAVKELRVALTVDDLDAALAFYRDPLGLPLLEAWSDDGRVVLLDAGRATLELLDQTHAAAVDRIEVGRRGAGPVRLPPPVGESAGAWRGRSGWRSRSKTRRRRRRSCRRPAPP